MSRKGMLTSSLQLLPQVDDDDLRKFVGSLVRSNKNVQRHFIVRFADHLDMKESERYEWLYHRLFHAVRNGQQNGVSSSQQRTLAELFKELLEQGKDALVTSHFLKTFHICIQGIMKIRIIHQRSDQLSPKLLDCYHDHLALLYDLFDARLPPSLTDEMYAFIQSEYDKDISDDATSRQSLLRLWLRLKLRLDGLDCFKADSHLFTIDHYETLEACERFYFTLLTEHWPDEVWETINRLHHPMEMLRHIVRKLLLRGEREQVGYIQDHLQQAAELSSADLISHLIEEL